MRAPNRHRDQQQAIASAACAVLERLEDRYMLSETGGTPAFRDVITMEWQGHEIRARAGEWIVSLDRPEPTRDADGEVIASNVRVSRSHSPSERLSPFLNALDARGIEFGRYLGTEHAFTIETPVGMAHAEIAGALASLPDFVEVSPNEVRNWAVTTPNDTEYGNQYALNNTGQNYGSGSGTADADIDAPEAWDFTTGSSSVVVAVLDSGVNYNHEDLLANRWENPHDRRRGRQHAD